MTWIPARTFAETDAILCTTGNIHEIDTILVDGRLQRVYKNLWPSLRAFWLSAVEQYAQQAYIVFEGQRLSYQQVHERAVKTAAVFRHVFGVKKGDRVGICSRNCPDYLVAFWACHLIGAVSVLANAWLPIDPLRFCLSHTECKLILLDPERASLLEPITLGFQEQIGTTGFLVFDSHEGKGSWKGMSNFPSTLANYRGETGSILNPGLKIEPEDNSTIMFTSGTTGLPKGVLSTQRQFLTNVVNTLVGGSRAALRRGEAIPSFKSPSPQKGVLVSVPLFHVTGTTSFSIMATMTGMKIVLMKKWISEEAVRLIKEENVGVAGGVPAMVADLAESSLVGHPLEGLLFGGSSAPDSLVPRARKAFPTATMSQAYGLTETNSIAVSFSGEDYTARPTSTGRASPVNDIKIINNDICVPPGTVGEVWLRGPNIMKCYWGDSDATARAITADGWLRTGDLGYLDKEGFLYIKDRLKDIIIRGGENVDSVSVENALYADPRISEAAAVGVPDERLGELVAAVVSVKPAFQGRVTEASLVALARKSLPRFAVPVMIILLDQPFEHTPSGKIVKGELRQIARRHWEARLRAGTAREALANL
ncbi:acetyl-CoA synthetase-like protein [Pluteus cervinus]|uniref:Acetyl-CoA synthetase-like protein n=1 Tax=Pluteus cervinus TaxID=181527 RepID=A0ACD3BC45_9AGAR|nr:acetyl-CoA synthetase-like protein [Pluteus cervinus]